MGENYSGEYRGEKTKMLFCNLRFMCVITQWCSSIYLYDDVILKKELCRVLRAGKFEES